MFLIPQLSSFIFIFCFLIAQYHTLRIILYIGLIVGSLDSNKTYVHGLENVVEEVVVSRRLAPRVLCIK